MQFNILNIGLILAASIVVIPYASLLLGAIVGAGIMFVTRDYKIRYNFGRVFFAWGVVPVRDPVDVVASGDRKGQYRVRYNDVEGYAEYRYFKTEAERDSFVEELISEKEYSTAHFLIWICAIALAVLTVMFHFIFWPTVYLASFIGFMFVLRWICDLGKYIGNVKSQLDAHKADPKAHTEPKD